MISNIARDVDYDSLADYLAGLNFGFPGQKIYYEFLGEDQFNSDLSFKYHTAIKSKLFPNINIKDEIIAEIASLLNVVCPNLFTSYKLKFLSAITSGAVGNDAFDIKWQKYGKTTSHADQMPVQSVSMLHWMVNHCRVIR